MTNILTRIAEATVPPLIEKMAEEFCEGDRAEGEAWGYDDALVGIRVCFRLSTPCSKQMNNGSVARKLSAPERPVIGDIGDYI